MFHWIGNYSALSFCGVFAHVTGSSLNLVTKLISLKVSDPVTLLVTDPVLLIDIFNYCGNRVHLCEFKLEGMGL